MTYTVEPIAFVHAERTRAEDDHWGGTHARIELTERFEPDALAGLDAFSHVEVLFLFHTLDASDVTTGARHPRSNTAWPKVGIFAQRGKGRPNRIGSTICRVVSVEGRTLTVLELDAIDGTPVLDIKPVMREFLPRETTRQPGWVAELMADYWTIRP
jgi:tRNA-Thr(GGU) m(6)t(6)A37 methyltransferase TsaA